MSVDELRDVLLGQLAHLIDEVEAFSAIVDRVPEPLQDGRPPGEDFSIKEIYGILAARDGVTLPRLRQMTAEDEPVFDPVDDAVLAAQEDWNAQSIDAVLGRVWQARRRLVAFLRGLPPEAWARTARLDGERFDVYALAHRLIRHDADLLRVVGYRLYEGRPR